MSGPAGFLLKTMGAMGLDEKVVNKLGDDFTQTLTWFKQSLVTIHGQNVQILANQAAILAHLAELRDYAKGAVPNDNVEPSDLRS